MDDLTTGCPTPSVRYMVPWGRPQGGAELSALVRHPVVAAIRLHGAALADAAACRALTASILAETGSDDLPVLVVLEPHRGATEELRAPDPRHLGLDLASGGEDFEVTLKVLSWARPVAEMGVDLVLSPRLDRNRPPLGDPHLAARLAAAWTEALLAAGLVACAGPLHPEKSGDDDAWAPFGAALAHGLESVFLDSSADLDALGALRSRADSLVVVGAPEGDAHQALAGARAGVDLVSLGEALAPEEIDAVLERALFETFSEPAAESGHEASRVDALRHDWLV